MDFYWQPTFEGVNGPWSTSGALYTHLMYQSYVAPCGVPLSNFWNPGDQLNNSIMFMGNLTQNETFADDFIQCLTDFTQAYPTNNVLYSFANDFSFIDANSTFELMDSIIGFVTTRTDKFHFVYSTVDSYLHAVRGEMSDNNITLDLFQDDFFPLEM